MAQEFMEPAEKKKDSITPFKEITPIEKAPGFAAVVPTVVKQNVERDQFADTLKAKGSFEKAASYLFAPVPEKEQSLLYNIFQSQR